MTENSQHSAEKQNNLAKWALGIAGGLVLAVLLGAGRSAIDTYEDVHQIRYQVQQIEKKQIELKASIEKRQDELKASQEVSWGRDSKQDKDIAELDREIAGLKAMLHAMQLTATETRNDVKTILIRGGERGK